MFDIARERVLVTREANISALVVLRDAESSNARRIAQC